RQLNKIYDDEKKNLDEVLTKKQKIIDKEKERADILEKGTFMQGWMLGLKEIEEELSKFGERGFNAVYDMNNAISSSFKSVFDDGLRGQLGTAEDYIRDFAARVASVWTDMAAVNLANWVVSGITGLVSVGKLAGMEGSVTMGAPGSPGKISMPSPMGAGAGLSSAGGDVHVHMEGSTFLDKNTLDAAVGVATNRAMRESYTSNKFLRKVTR
ncbi:MAG: hypothetical protein ABIH23_31765, partial [bacterium]